MIDIKIKYMAAVFLDGRDMKATPNNVTRLVDLFSDKELIPSTFREISADAPVPEVRIRLSTTDEEWVIPIGSRRINIERNPTDLNGDSLGKLDDFSRDVVDFSSRILTEFRKKANRLSLVATYLLREMSEEDLRRAYLKLFRPPPFYQSHEPFEWVWRSVSRARMRVAGVDQALNVVTTLRRQTGEMGKDGRVLPLDRIQLSLDLNTIGQETEHRFGLPHIRDFYDRIVALHDDVLQGVLGFIDEH